MILLGISETHTCTAALMIDGEIAAAVSEERFSRRKGLQGFPQKAIHYCLENIPENRELDKVVLSAYSHLPYNFMVSRSDKFSVQDHLNAQYKYFKPILIDGVDMDTVDKDFYGPLIEKADISDTNYDWQGFSPAFQQPQDIDKFREIRINTFKKHAGVDEKNIIFVDHHMGHAAYAYYASPFRGKDTLVLTMDGEGEGKNCTVSIAKEEKIERIFESNKCTIGKHWRYITLLLGMKPEDHEYKVMGLAPYAKEYMVKKVEAIFDEHLEVDGIDFKYNKRPTDLYFYYRDLLEGHRFDAIAGGLQRHSEKLITKWVKNCIEHTGLRRVVFSGGVAMNIKINKAIAEIPEIEEFFVPGSGGDESVAIGACYCVNAKNSNENASIKNMYLGSSFSEDEIEDALVGHDFKVIKDISNKEVAKYLSEGKIIARCVDRMEFGARALGNRSIIADPSRPETLEKINSKIKFRDFWMPFTPTVLSERANDYIINPKELLSPFMTIAFEATELGETHLKAAIHPEDKTVRPQILEENYNPQYYDLIKEFEKQTGIGGLLNTSLNLHGEPVVCSPKDAIHTFINSDLDMLLLNRHLICRR